MPFIIAEESLPNFIKLRTAAAWYLDLDIPGFVFLSHIKPPTTVQTKFRKDRYPAIRNLITFLVQVRMVISEAATHIKYILKINIIYLSNKTVFYCAIYIFILEVSHLLY